MQIFYRECYNIFKQVKQKVKKLQEDLYFNENNKIIKEGLPIVAIHETEMAEIGSK